MIDRRLRSLRRAITMSPAELAHRAAQATWKLEDRFFPPTPPAGQRWRGTPALPASAPFRGVDASEEVADYLAQAYPEQAARIVRTADQICAGEFQLLGIQGLSLGDRPEWRVEPVSGHDAGLAHWSTIPYLDSTVVGDSKVVWELNRHHFLITLGQAYRLQGDVRYALKVWDLIDSWIDQNPPGRGINWTSSLEVALRAIAWCWAWHLADGGRFLRVDRARRMAWSLEHHGRHIRRYLSSYFSPNTHLTGEALGLAYLATFWPTLPKADHWWRLGSRILHTEATRQIAPDGMQFERSACYQQYTLDFYLHFLLLCRARSVRLPRDLRDHVIQLINATEQLRRPDGLLPNFGDDDGGKLMFLGMEHALDPSVSLVVGSALLGSNLTGAPSLAEAGALWILGTPQFRRTVRARSPKAQAAREVLLSSGIITSRLGGDYLIASVGNPQTARRPAHSHDDALNIELWLSGKPVLVDPGTFTYAGDLEQRKWFRSAQAHNAPTVESISPEPPTAPFRWQDHASGRLHAIATCEGALAVEMRRTFGRREERMELRRSVIGWRDVGWIIWDRCHGKGRRRVTVRHQFASPDVMLTGDGSIALPGVRVVFSGELTEPGIEFVRSDRSSQYGKLDEAKAAVVSRDARLPADLLTVVVPAPAAGPVGTAQPLPSTCVIRGENPRFAVYDMASPDNRQQRIVVADGNGVRCAIGSSVRPINFGWFRRQSNGDVAALLARFDGSELEHDPSIAADEPLTVHGHLVFTSS